MKHTTPLLFFLIPVALLLCSCGGPPPPPAPPPPEVTISRPAQGEVTTFLEYTGAVAALESVEIRARVAGYLESIHFEPRAKVKAGDILFVIDPRLYDAKVEQAKAVLEARKAALRIRGIELEKYEPLATKQVIPELKLDDVKAGYDMASAEVAQASSNIKTATLDQDYAHVRSPINGRVSRNLVDVGNLVGATENTLLAHVVNDDTVYVYFNISESDLLRLNRKAPKPDGDSAPKLEKSPAYMGLSDEVDYPRSGKLDYTDIKVDSSTGTIQVRAVFPNTDGMLYPGMFARIRIPLETRTAVLVPDSALQTDQAGKYVLICNAENKVELRRVRVGEPLEDRRVIEEGLTLEDRVIINGVQKARPGAPVTPIQAPAPSTTAPPGSSSPSAK